MDAKAILEDLFQTSKEAARKGVTLAEEKLGVPKDGEERDAMLAGMSKGALVAGAIALLLGTKGGRSLTGTAVKLGGLAAVGGVAYKVFKEWQSGQQGVEVSDTGTPLAELDERSANDRSLLLIRSMISAAKADGHVDAAERKKITEQINKFGLEEAATSFLMTEINAELNPEELAASVTSSEEAAEVYLASAMVIEVDEPQERLYLNRLAKALGLAPELTEALESQIYA